MSIFNNPEENYWRNFATKRFDINYRCYHCLVPSSQRRKDVPVRCWKAMDVWFRHRKI